MKRVPAIKIEIKSFSVVCTNMNEYNNWIKYFKRHKDVILNQELIIANEAETIEELATLNN